MSLQSLRNTLDYFIDLCCDNWGPEQVRQWLIEDCGFKSEDLEEFGFEPI